MYYSQCINCWCIWCTIPMGCQCVIPHFTHCARRKPRDCSALTPLFLVFFTQWILYFSQGKQNICITSGLFNSRIWKESRSSFGGAKRVVISRNVGFSVNWHHWTINVILVQKDILKTVKLSLLGLMAKIKCSICSYRFDSWYVLQCGTSLLNGFLVLGVGLGACSVRSTHRPGIAVPPGTVHPPWGEHSNKEKIIFVIYRFSLLGLMGKI